MLRLEYLTDKQVKSIFEDALELLRTNGIKLTHEEMRDLLADKKAVIKGEMVKLPSKIVEEAVDSAPKGFNVSDLSGREYALGPKGGVCFAPGSAARYFKDKISGRRKPLVSDLKELVRVNDGLNNIAFQSSAVVPFDDYIPDELRDSYRLFICLSNSAKPIVTGTFGSDESLDVMIKMLEVVGGKRSAIFDICPTSTLKWEDQFVQNIIDCGRKDYIVEWVTMPMPGVNCPRSLYLAVVQGVAEALSGFVLSQTAQKGAPVIMGCSPMGPDMRNYVPQLGDTATIKTASAYAQVGRELGFPTHAYLGAGGGEEEDYQAGAETGISAVRASDAGINVVSGPGMFGQEVMQSTHKLVLDNYYACGYASNLAIPIETETEIPLESIRTGSNPMDYAEKAAERVSSHGFYHHDLRETRPLAIIDKEGRIDLLKGRVEPEIERLKQEWKPVLDSERAAKLVDIMNGALEKYGANIPDEDLPVVQ